jgi:predicted PurR-regulated permease PerM
MYSELDAKDVALQEREKKHTTLDANFIWRFWIFGALVAYFSYIIFKTLDAVYLILAAFVVSMILDAPITFFTKYMHRGLAITLSYLLVL